MKNFFLILIFLSFSVNSNYLPELGSHSDSILTKVEEKKVANKILQNIYKSNSLFLDLEIDDYLKFIVTKLSKQGTQEKLAFEIFMLNDPTINAFAMLGNIIGVHSGLLLASRNESEFASVLSHEIAHITQKHLVRLIDSQSRESYKNILAVAVAILAARSNPELATGVLTAANASIIKSFLSFTRENEKEADRVGLSILTNAGFDPRGFISFFETMQKFNRFSSGPAPSFLRTHPVTNDRISDLEDRVRIQEFTQQNSSLQFFLAKAKLQVLVDTSISPSEIFKLNIENKTYLNEKAEFFGLAYALLKENKIIESQEILEKLKLSNLDSSMIVELEALILIKSKKIIEAINVYLDGIKKYPRNRALIYGLAKLFNATFMFDKAINLLKDYSNHFSTDSILYEILAASYAGQKSKFLEHESLSYCNYYKYDFEEAISQIDLAIKAPDGNFFQKSRAEYRLKQLQRELELMNNQ